MVEGSLLVWAMGSGMSKSRGGRRSSRATWGGLVPVISANRPNVVVSATPSALFMSIGNSRLS